MGQVLDTLSFGHTSPIAIGGHTIPHFTLSGSDGHSPSIFSDRVQLTPPFPGNKRGALWAETPLHASTWDLNLDFRASGDERGSGNLQLWLVKDKAKESTLASVYTIDRFDGLGLVLDQYGGTGGSLRGFLNDGSTPYRQRTDIADLSFGHCNYAYRNLGRFSNLRVSQGPGTFEVRLDNNLCFASANLQIPEGYYFGLSAASAENADAFEVAKFVVTSGAGGAPQHQQQQQQQEPSRRSSPPPSPNFGNQQSKNSPSDAAYAQSMAEFFASITALSQKLDHVAQQVAGLDAKIATRQEELKSAIPRSNNDQLNSMAARLEAIEGMVREVKRESESGGRESKNQLRGVQDAIRRLEGGFGESVGQSTFSFFPPFVDPRSMVRFICLYTNTL